MDYSNIFTSMQAEVTLIAVIVLLFLYDLIAGERGRRRFSAVACGLLALQVAVNVVPGTPGEVFGGMFQYVPMHSIVKSVLTVGTLIVFLQADAWLRRGDTAHKQGEFYILTLSTLLGMYLMVGAATSCFSLSAWSWLRCRWPVWWRSTSTSVIRPRRVRSTSSAPSSPAG